MVYQYGGHVKRVMLLLMVLVLLSLTVIPASAGVLCPSDSVCTKPRIMLTLNYPARSVRIDRHKSSDSVPSANSLYASSTRTVP